MSRASNNRRRDDLDEYWFEKIPVTTKTPEEIREHTIPEDLPPIARTLALLDSRNDIQRLAGIRSIESVIKSDRDETFRRVLPKFKLIIEQTVDHEEHTVAAETIVSMIQQQTLLYSEFMSLFSQMFCASIFPRTTNRFSIDFGAIWCEALCNIIDALPNTTSFISLLDVIFNRTLHGSYVRDRLAIILSKLSSRVHAQTVENRILPVFKNFINDTNAEIRTLACQHLPIIAQSLESNKIVNLILPLLVTLSEDENLIARQTCFESLLDLRNQLKDSQSIEQVGEMIISLVKFGLSSNVPTFTTTIASRISDLCQALTIFQIDECEFIHELFLRLCQEKDSFDCRFACAKHFTSVIEYLDEDEMTNKLQKIFFQFCNSNDPKIRSIMISTIIHLAKLSKKKHTKYIPIIWDGFLSILTDSNLDVMLAIASNLLNVFMAFSRDENEEPMNRAISSIPAIPDSDLFLSHLLEYERRLFETTLSWRSFILCLQSFVHLPYILSSEQVQAKILPRVFSRIYSKQVCVREVAVDTYVQLLRKIPRRSTRRNAYQKLKTDLLYSSSYQWRIMYIRACRQILVHYSKRFFKENFLDTILPIESDPVLSVRIQLIPLLIEIKSILRYPADRQFISKIEKMMGCFLADKTLTLHDLANNGLLQLDQIRSYNPLSMFSNHSSNDNSDQKKEREEDFLDDLDSSSRRASSKSGDQSSSARRVAELALSTKPTKLTRTCSDDNQQRKSSLPTDSSPELKEKKIPLIKQERRQALAGNTTPARLSAQPAVKKMSKCKINTP